MKPLVYILLLNYNNYNDTIECIESLKNINYDNYRILIIDNNSTNASVEILNKTYPMLQILQTGSNLGFAGGNNCGINYALSNGADYILLLNNDTIVEKDFLIELLSSFEKHEKVGVSTCKVMYHNENNIIWYAGGEIDWFKFLGRHFGIKEQGSNDKYNEEKEIGMATGCVMLIKREVFTSVGLLPEEYFMYLEDVDFSVKVLETGYKIIYNPKGIVYHKVSVSTGGEESLFSIEWDTRNRIIFRNKYKYLVSKNKYVLAVIFFYIFNTYRVLKFIKAGNIKKISAVIKGLKAGRAYIRKIN